MDEQDVVLAAMLEAVLSHPRESESTTLTTNVPLKPPTRPRTNLPFPREIRNRILAYLLIAESVKTSAPRHPMAANLGDSEMNSKAHGYNF